MYCNGGYVHVSVYLGAVHTAMYEKFMIRARAFGGLENIQAKKLQNFLQDIKNYEKDGSYKGPINEELFKRVIERIQAKTPGAKGLFRRRGGLNLENDLSKIMASMYEEALNNHLPRIEESAANILNLNGTKIGGGDFIKVAVSQINVGNVRGTTGGFVNEEVGKVLKEIAEASGSKIKNENKPPYTLVDVQQKIDVQGLNLQFDINGDFDPYFMEMLEILNEAKISAKNYASSSKDGKSKLDEIFPNLHLGNSNPYRAFSGVLSNYGADSPTIISAFCASWHDYMNGNSQIGVYIYHFRLIYELTGMGIIGANGKSADLVKYLVYNDPAGDNIYVESTAEIICQILEEDIHEIENPFGRNIVISKASMKSHRYTH